MASNVEQFATKAAQSSSEEFAAALGALGVLVRLDERGGDDEPAPWAFHNAKHIPQTSGTGPRDDVAMNAEALREALSGKTNDGIDSASFAADDDAPLQGPDPDLFADDDDKAGANAETVTRTFDGRVRLPIPPARGAASVVVIEEGDRRIVGRNADADVIIGERSVSKSHAVIETEEDGTFTVVDQGSRNGTKVNGRRVKSKRRVPLRPGDIIAFGDVMCLFLSAELLHKHVATFMD